MAPKSPAHIVASLFASNLVHSEIPSALQVLFYASALTSVLDLSYTSVALISKVLCQMKLLLTVLDVSLFGSVLFPHTLPQLGLAPLVTDTSNLNPAAMPQTCLYVRVTLLIMGLLCVKALLLSLDCVQPGTLLSVQSLLKLDNVLSVLCEGHSAFSLSSKFFSHSDAVVPASSSVHLAVPPIVLDFLQLSLLPSLHSSAHPRLISVASDFVYPKAMLPTQSLSCTSAAVLALNPFLPEVMPMLRVLP